MAKLAFYTLSVLVAPVYDPEIASMMQFIHPMWDEAAKHKSFLGYAIDGGESCGKDWGKFMVPAMFKDENARMKLLSVLSLWETLEGVYNFTYSGVHQQALKRGREWFLRGDYPDYVAWWVGDDHTPTWMEASERYNELRQKGASANAFTFKQVYDPQGRPCARPSKRGLSLSEIEER